MPDTGWASTVTGEGRHGLGPLGRRLLAAFVLVALSSVVVLTVAALIGTSRGLTAGEDAQREAVTASVAAEVANAYQQAGGWAGADLGPAFGLASSAGAGLTIRDSQGQPVTGAMGMMPGGGAMGAGRGAVSADIVVDGTTVGSVRLGFGSPSTSTAQNIAWTWILIAAVVALVVAFVVAWYVSGWIAGPLVRLSAVARAFAAGDRRARSAPADAAAPGELGDLARAFDATADDVVRSEQTRRRMSADVAHELRTPLAALQAGLEELRDGLVPPDEARLASLHAQSVRLSRVVDDLAELSAAETAVLSMQRIRVDVSALARDAVSAARPAVEAAGIAVDLGVEPEGIVVGDPDRLHQVVGNLLANTVRYCRAGDSVQVAVRVTDTEVVLSVADTGPGIDPSDLPRVFDRLWRGSADRDGAGTGIGLAVVRELVTAHGGLAEVDSDGRSGTTFTIRLPRAGSADR